MFLKGALGLLTIPSALVILSGMLLKEIHTPNFPYGQVRKKCCSFSCLTPHLSNLFFTLVFPFQLQIQAHKKFVEASGKMLTTLKCPEVWRPCVYMYVSLALSVDIQEGMFYWYTDRKAGLSFHEVHSEII